LNLAALKSVLEDCVEPVGSSNLMLMVGLSATTTDVSLRPFSETSHDLFDSDAWVIAIVAFCIDEAELAVSISSSSVWSWVSEFKLGWDDVGVCVRVVQRGLLVGDAASLVALATAWSTVLKTIVVETTSLGVSQEGLSLGEIQPLSNAATETV